MGGVRTFRSWRKALRLSTAESISSSVSGQRDRMTVKLKPKLLVCGRFGKLALLTTCPILGFILLLFIEGGRKPLLPHSEFSAVTQSQTEGSESQVLAKYDRLPLTFEPNEGQTDRRVEFLARRGEHTIFLTPDTLLLRLQPNGSRPGKRASTIVSSRPSILDRSLRQPGNGDYPSLFSTQHRRLESVSLTMTLTGANPRAKLTGLDEVPAKSNYFIGNDPKKWRTNVPNYSKIRCKDAYPGIDLVYYGDRRQLEYDFIVAPGASPKDIILGFDGSAGAKAFLPPQISTQGDLLLHGGDAEIRFHKPVAYQTVHNGLQAAHNDARRFIESRYVIKGRNQVGIELAAYDPRRPLIIDPVLSYSTYLGGGRDEGGSVIAVDVLGSAYVIGSTSSVDFPTTPHSFQPTFRGGSMPDNPSFDLDAFVVKLNPSGSGLVYSTYLGGSGGEFGNGIAVDPWGNAYATGFTRSTDFPITAGALQTVCRVSVSGECGKAFVTKLAPNGSALVYSTYFGGTSDDYGIAITPDYAGNTYVTGYTDSKDLPTTPGAFQKTCNTSIAVCDGSFVAKFNSKGSALIYSTYLGGRGTAQYSQQGYSIAVDLRGDAFVAGITDAADFPTTPKAFQRVCKPGASNSNCNSEAFVVKVNPAGSALLYATYLGGSDFDQAANLALDIAGNAYVTGYTASVDFPTTTGAFQTACKSNSSGVCSDGFVTKLNRTGSGLVYSTYLGGSGDDVAASIAVSPSGNAFVAGWTSSSDFPIVRAFQPVFGGGFQDAFVTKIGASGGDLVDSSYLGGTSDDVANSIALHGFGVYLTGATISADFPVRSAIQPTLAGGVDAFVVKIGPPHDKTD
jgi:hypothetical protein